jgi:hypothetical protein
MKIFLLMPVAGIAGEVETEPMRKGTMTGSFTLATVLLPALATLLLLTQACGSAPPDFLLGGIQVNEADHGAWFRALHKEELNTVSVTIYAHQGDWNSDTLWWNLEDEEWVLKEIQGARAAGLQVVLIPRVALDHAFPVNRFLWHGLIQPTEDVVLESWFQKYDEFILHWANIAEREGVAVLAVGSEMSAMTSTRQSEELPALLRWYLDDLKQDERIENLETYGDGIDRSHLELRGGETFPDIGSRAREERETLRNWARITGFQDSSDPLTAIRYRQENLEKYWRTLIRKVRAVYSGRLTYAANFDQYQEVGFWDALDLIGINAYFPLRTLKDRDAEGPELYDVLLDSWRTVLNRYTSFREENELGSMPVLLTEIGYTRRRRATLAPWAGSGFALLEEPGDDLSPPARMVITWEQEPLVPQERAMAMAALDQAHREHPEPFLDGLLYWKLSTIHSHLEIEPFVCMLGEEDPLLESMRAFLRPHLVTNKKD